MGGSIDKLSQGGQDGEDGDEGGGGEGGGEGLPTPAYSPLSRLRFASVGIATLLGRRTKSTCDAIPEEASPVSLSSLPDNLSCLKPDETIVMKGIVGKKVLVFL